MKNKINLLLKLFTATFCISAFTFGGGYVIVPLMRKKFVDKLHWIDDEEMLILISIAQSSPGAIAVNASIAIGYKVAGLAGIFVALLASVLPPFAAISIICIFYIKFKENPYVTAALKAMSIAVCAVIFDVIIKLIKPYVKSKNIKAISVIVFTLIMLIFFKINIIIVILLWLFIATADYLLKQRR